MQTARSWLLILIVVGPVVGGLVYGVAAEYERERTMAAFEEHVGEGAAAFEQTGRSVFEVLHSLRAFFDASDVVQPEEFATFTREILSTHPSIRALEWAPAIPEQDRISYEARSPASGITERYEDGELGPALSREVYYPVTYVQPLAGNEAALGFDLASEPARRAALERALATDVVILTDPVRLVQNASEADGFLALLAVRGAVDGSGSGSASAGVVVAVFRAKDLVTASFLRDGAHLMRRMHFAVLDAHPASVGETLLLASSYTPPRDAGFSSTRSISLGGQMWKFEASPTEGFLEHYRSRQPLLLALLLVLLFEGAFGALFVASRRARDAAARSHALKIQAVLRSLHDGVIVVNAEGRIELTNQAATDMMGPIPRGRLLQEWSA